MASPHQWLQSNSQTSPWLTGKLISREDHERIREFSDTGELKLHHELHPVALTSYGRAFERRGKQDVGKSRLTKSNFWLHNLTVTSYQLRKSVMLLQKFKAPSNAPAAYPSSNLSMLLADFIHYLLARLEIFLYMILLQSISKARLKGLHALLTPFQSIPF